MKRLLIIGLISICIQAKSQEDYLITLKGDTIRGNIEFFQNTYFDEVIIKSDQGKESFKIYQIRRILRKGNEYGMVTHNNKKEVAQIIKEGKLSLYMVRDENNIGFNIKYLLKENGEYMLVPNIRFRKLMKEFFDDCDDLASQIENKSLSSNDLDKIIDFYNISCQ